MFEFLTVSFEFQFTFVLLPYHTYMVINSRFLDGIVMKSPSYILITPLYSSLIYRRNTKLKCTYFANTIAVPKYFRSKNIFLYLKKIYNSIQAI